MHSTAGWHDGMTTKIWGWMDEYIDDTSDAKKRGQTAKKEDKFSM